MRVALICTVKNEESSISTFLDSVRSQTIRPDEFVIVDGGSTDRTRDIIMKWRNELNIKLLVAPCNIARGRNIAIQETTCDIIAVSDAGVILDTRWLELITAPFTDPSIDVVAGHYAPRPGSTMQVCMARFAVFKPERIGISGLLPSSRSIAFRRSVWERAEGYPESLDMAEDTAFDLKLIAAGARFHYEPRAIVYWNPADDLREFVKKRYRYAFWDGVAGIPWRKGRVIGRLLLGGLMLALGIAQRNGILVGLCGMGMAAVALLDMMQIRDYLKPRSSFCLVKWFPVMVLVRILNDLTQAIGFVAGLTWRPVWRRKQEGTKLWVGCA